MNYILGHLTLICALLLTFLNNINFIRVNYIRFLSLLFVLISISLFTTIYNYIINNFTIHIISSHSHTLLPLFYKIAALWSSHEGSILLWTWIIIFYSLLVNSLLSHTNIEIKRIFNFIILFFLFFTWFTSNPYLLNLEVTLNGKDLNPLLQDPFLLIHPPILYIGYIATFIPFILITYSKNIKISLIFTYISWIFLTLGILLGSWWAYYELGWGGYWFWDPVENIALLPWIALTGLIHSLILYRKTNQQYYWSQIFSSLALFSSFIGTFFVRSGLLSSIHSFVADKTRGLYLLAFIISLLITICYSTITKVNLKELYKYHTISKNNSINIGNWLFLLTFILITLGTFLPSIYQIIWSTQITIGSNFYNTYLVPFIILILFTMIVTPFLQWKENKQKIIIFTFINTIIIEIFIYTYLRNMNITNHLISILSILLITTSSYYAYLIKYKYQQSMIISHIGFGILLLAIVLNNEYEIIRVENLLPGEKINLNNYQLTLWNTNELNGTNFNTLYGNMIINFKENILGVLVPDIRHYFNHQIITNKSMVISNYITDIYSIIVEGNEYQGYQMKINYKPYIPLLWISGFIIIWSGVKRIKSQT